MKTLALRREDLDKKAERRAAIPPVLARQITKSGHRLLVQPGTEPHSGESKRAFADEDYLQAGAELREDIGEAAMIFGLKEVEIAHLLPHKAYFMFSHTHKGQRKNRELLHRLIQGQNTLIDYELITDEAGRRLLTAFTYFAGYAGMTDSLWTLGQRLAMEGIAHPFSRIPQSATTGDLEQIKGLIKATGDSISQKGTPTALPPLICAFLGKGKTSTGAQEIYDLLPVKKIGLEQLPQVYAHGDRHYVYKVVLGIGDMYRLKDDSLYVGAGKSKAQLEHIYLESPAHFESNMGRLFPHCSIWMNCIIWSSQYPRLISYEQAAKWYQGSSCLRVIGDITCDPEGAIHFSRETWIDEPVFTYQPLNREFQPGIQPSGIAVMAVTNLPCEFSEDASLQFARELAPLLPGILAADYEAASVKEARLPPAVARAVILWRGAFTDSYAYMGAYALGDET